ncbi:uncharacterized protein Dsimw501_GD29392 [Drosophila simulans]|uniref:Uncharacterized protein n=1 Tax=Drosophila simulans TaxID=7240 RepID=A0A0J9RPI9_DROSI|nr:uncharacterized protein Dsimw501_GD29392 [Drosophila simulans]
MSYGRKTALHLIMCDLLTPAAGHLENWPHVMRQPIALMPWGDYRTGDNLMGTTWIWS